MTTLSESVVGVAMRRIKFHVEAAVTGAFREINSLTIEQASIRFRLCTGAGAGALTFLHDTPWVLCM